MYGRPSMVFGGGPLTPAIKGIIIACVIVFLIQAMLGVQPQSLNCSGAGSQVEQSLRLEPLNHYFGLSSACFLKKLWFWQPVTYLFLHGGLFHILMNMLVLWMFGAELERRWGSRAFLQFYLVCGVGAGLSIVALDPLVSLLPAAARQGWLSSIPTVGASGAVYGIMAAQAILFPNKMLLLFLFFPMRMRAAVLLLAAIMLFSQLTTPGSGISHVAHLGGMLFAWIYLHRLWNIRKMWKDWRRRVRRKKYRVVADIHDDDRFDYH